MPSRSCYSPFVRGSHPLTTAAKKCLSRCSSFSRTPWVLLVLTLGCLPGILAAPQEIRPAAAVRGEPPRLEADEYRLSPMNAKDLVASADGTLLFAAEQGAGGQPGTVAAIDPATGEVVFRMDVLGQPQLLAVSDDGQRLYAVTESGKSVQGFNLNTHTAEFRISLESKLPRDRDIISGLAALPGSGSSFAIAHSLYDLTVFDSLVAIYDGATARPGTTTVPGGGPVIFTDSETLFALNTITSDFGLTRMKVNAGGVIHEQDSGGNFFRGYGQLLAAGGGRLFCSTAEVADVASLTAWRPFEGFELGRANEPAPCAVDEAVRRVCYFRGPLSRSPYRSEVFVFDLDTDSLMGSMSFQEIGIQPGGPLVRWGDDGLASLTKAGQLLSLRTTLLPSGASTDLEVNQSFDLTDTSSPPLLRCRVTNSGTSPATGASLECIVTGARINEVRRATEIIGHGGHSFSETIALLEPGETMQWEIEFEANDEIPVVSRARVIGASADPVTGNNTSLVFWTPPDGTDKTSIASLTLQTTDFLADPVGPGLILAVASVEPDWGNGVVYLDPASGTFSSAHLLDASLGPLAALPGESWFYAGVRGAIQKVSLPGFELLDTLPLPAGSVPLKLAVFPDGSGRLAVWLENAPEARDPVLAIVAPDGTAMIKAPETYSANPYLAVSSDGSTVFLLGYAAGFYLRPFTVGEEGLIEEPGERWEWMRMGDTLKAKGDEVFGGGGQRFDLTARHLVSTAAVPLFEGWPLNSAGTPLVEPDLTRGRLYYLGYDGDQSVLLAAFEPESQRLLGTLPIPGVRVAGCENLVRFGEDGIAFKTSTGLLYLVQGGLLPSGPDADLSIHLTEVRVPTLDDSLWQFGCRIRNHGDQAISSVQARIAFPAEGTVSSLSATGCTAMEAPGRIEIGCEILSGGEEIEVEWDYGGAGSPLFTVEAGVNAACVDRAFRDNADALVIWNPDYAWDDPFVVAPTQAAGVTANSDRTRLFLLPGNISSALVNHVVQIDLATGQVAAPLYLGSGPRQLAISPDEQSLVAGLDGEDSIATVDLPSWSVSARQPLSNGMRATSLAFNPLNPSHLLVAQTDKTLLLLEDGSVLGDALPQVTAFAFDARDGTLYARGDTGGTLRRITVGETGLTTEESLDWNIGYGGVFQILGGRLIHDEGRATSVPDGTEVGRYSADYTELVLPAPHADQVLLLTRGWWRTHLRGYGFTSFEPRGILELPDESLAFEKAICWGEAGVALIRADGTLTLVCSPFLPGNPAPDVGLVDFVAPEVAVPGNPLRFACSVTNHSEVTAQRVTVQQQFSGLLGSAKAMVSAGTVEVDGYNVQWSLESLPPHGSAGLQTEVPQYSSPQLVSRTEVAAAGVDPNPANNLVRTFLRTQLPASPTVVASAAVDWEDLLWDSQRRVLWASTANEGIGPALLPIDPVRGIIGPGVPLPTEPGVMALSADQNSLFCALTGSPHVLQLPLDSDASPRFRLLPDFGSYPIPHADAIAADPNLSDGFFVTYRLGDSDPHLAVFGDENPAGVTAPLPSQGSYLAVDQGGETIFIGSPNYPYLHDYAWTAGMLLPLGESEDLTYGGGRLHHSGDLLFDASGRVIHAPSLSLWTDFGLNPGEIELIEGEHRLYYATPETGVNRARLLAYELGVLAFSDQSDSFGLPLPIKRLVRWGANGFALLSPGQFTIVRSDVVPIPPGSDYDQDGLPDDWESAHALNPNAAQDAWVDLDGDGSPTYDEWFAGTDFLNRDSVPRILSIAVEEGEVVVTFETVFGRRYELQGSATVGSDAWEPLGSVIQGNGEPMEVRVRADVLAGPSFVRLAITLEE